MGKNITQEINKKKVALAALDYLPLDGVLGLGTGSTVNYFIEALQDFKNKLEGVVPSSNETANRLKKLNIPSLDLNSTCPLSIYIDGADEINPYFQMIKGGGGALTREKIIASASKKILCIIDETKRVELLGKFPLAIEVLPIARTYVAKELVKLGGFPIYREKFITDNGNCILDTLGLDYLDPIKLEKELNQIEGLVASGLFAIKTADIMLVGSSKGVEKILKTV